MGKYRNVCRSQVEMDPMLMNPPEKELLATSWWEGRRNRESRLAVVRQDAGERQAVVSRRVRPALLREKSSGDTRGTQVLATPIFWTKCS